jgi:hypothetical protein
MAWSSKLNAELGIVDSAYAGLTTAADFRKGTTAAIALAKQAGTTRHLVDTSELVFAASLIDLYLLPASQFEREQADRRSRVALIPPADEKAREAIHFYQTACVNRGWTVKLFADRQAAIGWLRGEAGR